MNRILLRPNKEAYRGACSFMQRQLGFETIEIGNPKSTSIKSHTKNIVDGLYSVLKVTKKILKIRKAEIVLSIGNFSTLYIMMLNKLHIIRPKVVLWWGFFIHSKKVQKMLKHIFKLIYLSNVKFIVFSECEQSMYTESMEISKESLISMSYGNWENHAVSSCECDNSGDFFFTGGYSNRDYGSLLNSWVKNFPEDRLIVVGSYNNKDLVEFDNEYMGDKIEVFYDTPPEMFDEFLTGSIACILPFKENTGASGQSVMLRCMRYNKLVISVDTDIMREYVDNDSAILIKNYEDDLVKAVEIIKGNKDECSEMLKKQRNLYITKFSYENITKRLKKIIEEISA